MKVNISYDKAISVFAVAVKEHILSDIDQASLLLSILFELDKEDAIEDLKSYIYSME